MKRTQRAFTLAEVLITMAIISVVSAITIPVLVSNANSEQYKAAMKKNISILNSAINMNVANSGLNLTDASITDKEKLAAWFVTGSSSGTVPKNMAVLKFNAGADNDVWLTDGTRLSFWHTAVPHYGCPDITDAYSFDPLNDCFVIVDVNGDKPPNKNATSSQASDVWILGITTDAVIPVRTKNATDIMYDFLRDINGNIPSPRYTEILQNNDASYNLMINDSN